MANDTYIKISQLPEKDKITETDYLVAEDLQDTWKIRASHLTDYINQQVETITSSLDEMIDDSKETLQNIQNTQTDLENSIKEFNDAEQERQQNEIEREEAFKEMQDTIDKVNDMNLDSVIENIEQFLDQAEQAENQRQQNEIQRNLNEGERQQLADDLKVELQTAQNTNQIIQENETQRQQNEVIRENNEVSRQELYNKMDSLYDSLISSENDREKAESERESSFNQMQDQVTELISSVNEAEQGREQAEQERKDFIDSSREFIQDAEEAENRRVTAEQTRNQEFEAIKEFINNFEGDMNLSTKTTGCTISPMTSTENYATMCSVTLSMSTEESNQMPTDRFGMLFQIDEYDAAHNLVNKCIAYMSCTIGSTFSTISLRKTSNSTCDNDAIYVSPSADYKTLHIGYKGSTGNYVEFKLISDSSSNTIGYNRISCVVLNAVQPTSSPFTIAPITCANSPVADTKAYGYELFFFNMFNGAISSGSSISYPIGFQLRTTQAGNPGDTIGGIWEMVGSGAKRIVYTTISDDGSVTDVKTHTIYTWIKTGETTISASTYPIGFELRTVQPENPGDIIGGTWEMVGSGPMYIVLDTLGDSGEVTESETRTVYRWVKTA